MDRHLEAAHHHGIARGVPEAEEALARAERDLEREAALKLEERERNIALFGVEEGGLPIDRQGRLLGIRAAEGIAENAIAREERLAASVGGEAEAALAELGYGQHRKHPFCI